MNIGKQNIGRIQKGLKNNDITKENIVLDESYHTVNSTDSNQYSKVLFISSSLSTAIFVKRMNKQLKGQTPKRGFGGKNSSENSSSNMNSPMYAGTDTSSFSLQQNFSSNAFVPLGTRISDWYTTTSYNGLSSATTTTNTTSSTIYLINSFHFYRYHYCYS